MLNSTSARNLPPKPNLPGFIWQVQALFLMLETLESWQQEFGDVFCLPHDRHTFVCVASPTALETILKLPPSVMSSSQSGGIFEAVLGPSALITLEGKPHQQHRRLMLPPFHGAALQRWSGRIYDVAQVCLRQQSSGSLLLRPLVQEITLKTLLQVIFGDRPGLIAQLHHQMKDLFAGVESPLMAAGIALQWDWGEWSPWGAFVRRKAAIEDLLLAEIYVARRNSLTDADDVFTMLLQAHDEAGATLSEAELQDELITLCFAGYETTTSAIIWMLYWIYSCPEIETRLRLELREAMATGNSNAIAISRLPFLTSVCQESLRLYPVAIGGFTRRLIQPVEVDGFGLPAGTFIHPSIYLAHRRASVYPDPAAFKPDRFLNRSYSQYEYLPFGGGNRRCIGSEFAQLQMKLVAAAFLNMVVLQLDHSSLRQGATKPVRYGMTMAPPPSLKMTIQSIHFP